MADIAVLLVEDNPADAKLVEVMLKEANAKYPQEVRFYFSKCDSLTKAIELSKERVPDIVMLDLGLPDYSGIDTIKKAVLELPNTPIIAHTGMDDIHIGLEAMRLGAVGYMVKGEVSASLLTKNILFSLEQYRLKQELSQKEQMLIVQSKQAAMGEMISMIAHQWRQPLSTIGMSVNNMLIDIELGDIKPENFNAHLRGITEQVQYLSKTIDDFRNFFKPITQKQNIKVYEIIEKAMAMVAKAFENNGLKLIFEKSDEVAPINVNSGELLQVILSILNNAKDALIEKNREGGYAKMRVIASGKDSVIIEIEDNGGGIDERIMDKIFDPYFTTKTEKSGTGLGLYMAKIIVEKHHGGVLTAKNGEEGAIFSIEIPTTKAES